MKMPKNLVLPLLVVLVIVVIVVIWLNGSSKTVGVSKDSCDYRFLQWCKNYPKGGVDYDNFANEARECKGNGSYRTCDQVNEALG